jgi:hypothetical protein
LIQFASPKDYLEYTQKSFFALDLDASEAEENNGLEGELAQCGLDLAERDGTLNALGSTYSLENDAVYDGLSRQGVRLVTFAPVLKQHTFPLPKLIERILEICSWGMNCPVEVEFAVNLSVPEGTPIEFAIVQVRPFVVSREMEAIEIGEHAPETVLCSSAQVLGMGKVDDLRDVVVVDVDSFERARSREVAEDVGRMNAKLAPKNIPYLLIGVGRWGSSDPWLGIPVSWDQISGARIIVEAGFKDFKVTPSQGAHFFQNLTAHRIGYFTVNPDAGEGVLDWQWLKEQPAEDETPFVRHLRLTEPLSARMNGHTNQGVILKP